MCRAWPLPQTSQRVDAGRCAALRRNGERTGRTPTRGLRGAYTRSPGYGVRVSARSPDPPRKQVWVGSIVIRCRRFEEMLAFWTAALGYVEREPPADGWVILRDPTGRG